MISELVRYLVLIPNALGSMFGAGVIVAGGVITVVFHHLLPLPIKLNIIDTLPLYLGVIGSIIFLVTFFGSSGAFFTGSLGKWLLLSYIVSLTAVIVTSAFVTVVMFLNRDNTSEGVINNIGARIQNVEDTIEPALLTVAKTLHIHTDDDIPKRKKRSVSGPEVLDVPLSSSAEDSAMFDNDESDDTNFGNYPEMFEWSSESKVRKRSQFLDWGREKLKSVSDTVHREVSEAKTKIDSTLGLSEKTSKIMKTVDDAKHKVEEASAKVAEAVENAEDFAKSSMDKAADIRDNIKTGLADGADKLRSGIKVVKDGVEIVQNGAEILKSVATGTVFDSDDNRYVKLVRPILGIFTKPLFLLSRSTTFMAVVLICIFIEVLYVLMAMFLCYMKSKEATYTLDHQK